MRKKTSAKEGNGLILYTNSYTVQSVSAINQDTIVTRKNNHALPWFPERLNLKDKIIDNATIMPVTGMYVMSVTTLTVSFPRNVARIIVKPTNMMLSSNSFCVLLVDR